MPVEYGVTVEGLDELRKGLRKADKGVAKELGQAGKKAADIVAAAARPKVPSRSGKARASLRAVVVNGGGGVKGGGPRAAYYSWLDFGGSVGRKKSVYRQVIREGRYIYPTLAEKRDEVIKTYEELVDDALRKAGLR